ncbi:MAG TPA: Ig-like domain-containing protein, partial [Longimicrobiales bacterium]|nr:Ig-like domain-containing protein [Longimicrobiales bacterium]
MKVRTSVLKGFALLALSTFTFAACEDKTQPPPPPAVTVAVVPSSMSLQVGQTGPLVAIVSNATNTNVTWASSTPAVATVSATGVVTAAGPGTAVITATSAQDANVRGAAAVTVVAAPPSLVTIDLVPDAASVQVGGTVQLLALVDGTTNLAVTYTSSAATVAMVNTSGLVTGLAAGTAVITATSSADATKRDASVITVTAGPPPTPVSISIT